MNYRLVNYALIVLPFDKFLMVAYDPGFSNVVVAYGPVNFGFMPVFLPVAA
jgi:hypothetical protein